MLKFDAAELSGPVDWSGPTMPPIGTAVAKLRWINSPFHWHRNHGSELFGVLDGEVEMRVRNGLGAAAETVLLVPGQMLLIEEGEEHVAYPRGEARILVVEHADSE